MSKPRWRLYYGAPFEHPSGEERLRGTYSDLDGPPELAPALNVQVAVQWEWGVRTLQCGGMPHEKRDRQAIDIAYKGYFCYNIDGDELWSLTDAIGFFDYLATPGWKTVKFGRTIETPTFRACINRAGADPDFQCPART